MIDEIKTHIDEWITYLSEHSVEHGGPRCPYAKGVWNNDRVKIVSVSECTLTNFWSAVSEECIHFHKSKNDVVMVVTATKKDILNEPKMVDSLDALNVYLNVQKKDLWVLDGYIYNYTIALIQRISSLDDASIKLQNTSYYDHMNPHMLYKNIVRRHELRERLTKEPS